MPRLFIGIPLPDAYRRTLRPLTNRLAALAECSVNWSGPDTWHLTLKFLGETDGARIPAITSALADIDTPAFAMQAGGAGTFPNEKRPRVLWLGLRQGAAACAALAAAIEDALDRVGIPREQKRFRPHLTLGRVRKPGPGDWSRVLDAATAVQWPPCTVDRFVLWQSELAPTGAVHTPLKECFLR